MQRSRRWIPILFGGLNDGTDEEPVLKVWMSHGDRVESAAAGISRQRAAAPIRRWRPWKTEARHYYGVQFHPEVTHTPQGQAMI